jgi:hypothetical protein
MQPLEGGPMKLFSLAATLTIAFILGLSPMVWVNLPKKLAG